MLNSSSDANELDSQYDLSFYTSEDAHDPWEVFSQWSYDESGITINLSQYSGLPFVMGVFEILIPWLHFTDKLAEEFVGTEIGDFIVARQSQLA